MPAKYSLSFSVCVCMECIFILYCSFVISYPFCPLLVYFSIQLICIAFVPVYLSSFHCVHKGFGLDCEY